MGGPGAPPPPREKPLPHHPPRRPAVLISLSWLGALVIAGTVFGVVMTGGSIVRREDRVAYLARTHGQAERTLKAAIDPRFQSKAEEIGRVLTRLVVIGAIKGAALFDDSGHLQDTYGERTETSFEAVTHTGAKIFETGDPARAEFYLSPAVTGTPFHLLVRTDVAEMAGMEGVSSGRVMTLATAGAAAGGVAVLALVWFAVAAPIRRINVAFEKALANPGLADVGGPLHAGFGELATLVAGVERFRSSLADIWRTKVLVADAILESSPFAVVQLATDGSPIFGNPAATSLFDHDVVRHSQAAPPLIVRDVESGERALLREHLDHHAGQPRLVEIATPVRANYAVAASFTVGPETRAPTVVAMFADVGAIHRARVEADDAAMTALERSAVLVRREAELRLSLENSLALIAPAHKNPEVHIDVTPFAEEWLATAVDAGLLAPDSTVTSENPPVAGARDDLRAVVRLAMLLAYARCGRPPVTLAVELKGINFETVGATIRATVPPDARDERIAADWQLAMGALRAVIKRAGAQLAEFAVSEHGVVVKLVLRGAAERLATGRKSA